MEIKIVLYPGDMRIVWPGNKVFYINNRPYTTYCWEGAEIAILNTSVAPPKEDLCPKGNMGLNRYLEWPEEKE